MKDKIHVFEKSGLGKAPFKLVGCFEGNASYNPLHPNVPITSCQYCSTLIKNCFRIESADGKIFIVGSDCVKKTGDKGLERQVNEEIRKIKLAVTEKRFAAAMTHFDEIKGKLSQKPHPTPYFSDKSLLDYVEYFTKSKWISPSAQLTVARIIEKNL